MHRRHLAHTVLAAEQLGEPRFSRAQLDALFDAILVNDKIDLAAELPSVAPLACDQQMLVECYRLGWQLWQSGTERAVLARIVDELCLHGTLDADARIAFKHIRAKFKHLRAACATFGAEHRYPAAFHRMTATMGRLQDAFKNDRRVATSALAATLRVQLTVPLYRWARRGVDTFVPTTPGDYARYVADEMGVIRAFLARDAVSGHEFHRIRKVVSRQTACYCNLTVLSPSPQIVALFRYASAINGLMGQFHDGLVERRFDRVQDYRGDKFTLPGAIQTRLSAFVRWALAT